MSNVNIPYKSFCWVIGTTSFRTAKLNLKIEQQLLLLNDFNKIVSKNNKWAWNSSLQRQYYDFMKDNGFLYGKATRKDKDAREKTSGLLDIGLIDSNRLITDAGEELLLITREASFNKSNIFDVSSDSFIYLKQLLKTSIKVGEYVVRPFIVVIKCLTELDYLTYDEFTYLIPLIVDEISCIDIINSIKYYRKGELNIDDIIYNRLISMENYQKALAVFLDNTVDESLMCAIGLNRKSRRYDAPYLELYEQIKNIFLEGSEDYEKLLYSVNEINKNPGTMWKALLFQTPNLALIRANGKASISKDCPFIKCSNERELKEIFFKYLHVFKARATLEDYFDLNRRYMNLTDIIIFQDKLIELDAFPKYYFKEIMLNLQAELFAECSNLAKNIPLTEISDAFIFDINKVYSVLSKDLNIPISTAEQATEYINDKRYKRFNDLIDKKFSDSVLLELLDCFERRDDRRIEELVTNEATIPTIFEYILGIIWYKISERQGDILSFMKLSLDPNLLPKTHAAGGYADIIYEYESCDSFPKHALLLEATLTEKNNQRRMEMEPVSRHLGDYRIKFNNPFDYSLFVSTFLDKNVISDFRYRKVFPYAKDEDIITGMKIASIDTDSLKKIIRNKVTYKHLYNVFDKYYEMPLETADWHDNMIREATSEDV